MSMVKNQTAHEFWRFIVIRAVCAILTYGLYLGLLPYMSYQLAYVIAFAVGLVLAYAVNAKFVFREAMRMESAFRFPLVYVVQFAVGFFVLKLLVAYFAVPASLGLALSTVATIPLTFYLSRKIIRMEKRS